VPRVIPPVVDDDDRFFWDGVARGELLIQRCSGCGVLRHPPVPMCPHCLSTEWDTAPSAGRGTVHSWVLSHHPTEPDASPRIVALIALEEGVRMVSNLTGVAPSDVVNDMPVSLVFETFEGNVTLPQFEPAP
jgi:uncharacterized OB-fold protein